MKETAKSIGKCLRACHKGVISSWFFSIFLFCISLILTSAENDIRMMKTMVNLKTAEAYLEAEGEVIHHIRCLIQSDELTDGTYHTASYAYMLQMEEGILITEIMDPQEVLIIEYEEGVLMDYQTSRIDPATEE